MKFLPVLLALFLAAGPLPAQVRVVKPAGARKPAGPPKPAETLLRWKNGESLPGELISATAAAATWKSPLFEDPLVLAWHALSRIDRPAPAVFPPEAFSFVLRDGGHVCGDLVSISDTAVTLHSARHGGSELKRSEILTMRRLYGEKLLYAGPVGDAGWELKGDSDNGNRPRPSGIPAVPVLTVGSGGALAIPYWNRNAALAVKVPLRSDIEFRLRSSKRPDFALALEREGAPSVRLETWDDELVLTAGDRFQRVRAVAAEEREIALRFCWDGLARKSSVFTIGGELLTEWHPPDDAGLPVESEKAPGSARSLGLYNKGRDLTLESFRLQSWDGQPPAKFDARRPRIELLDGRVLEAELATATADTVTVRPADPAAPAAAIPIADVACVVFSPETPKPAESEVTVTYADGTLLHGRDFSLAEGRGKLLTLAAAEPLSARMEGFRQVKVKVPPPADAPPERPLEQLDKLVIAGSILHGQLAGGDDGRPRWQPLGGVLPALPSREALHEIDRGFAADASFPDASALFYMSGGDVLPGRLRSLDRNGIELESPVIKVTHLPVENLDAIQFNVGGKISVKGFADPAWHILQGDEQTVHRTGTTLEMQAETAIGHPYALQAGEIDFKIDARGYSTTRLRLFCAGTDRTQSTNLMLQASGNRVIAGVESTEGQLENQFQSNTAAGAQVSIRLVVRDKQVEVHIGGILVGKFMVDPHKRAGAGLIIEPAGLWGNQVRPVTLSDFSTPFTPGGTWVPDISAKTRLETLTIPRFRKDDPPRHALVAANGDVLRGEISSASENFFEFRSGLETLRVPRERVRAAIWLKKPDTGPAAPPHPEEPVLKLLEQPIDRRMGFGNVSLEIVLNFLQQQTGGELKYKLPEQEVGHRFRIQLGGQTIGEAIEQICAECGVHYRIDDKGVIVFEASPQLSSGTEQRIYWLKPDAFPAGASAQDLLAAKGVPFPAGATAVWQPRARQLTVTNTAANQRKLTDVLATDFGGSQGSPTHWLLLTNGARLGLAVELFGRDMVTGHHPLYGLCKVPVSEIYAIRTQPPPVTPAMKTFDDWHLVYAPEPVIPESGGQSSPLAGKEAKDFKLPLLDGGEFDLSKEKGKVVILDFWATWCGPCVKSLPGLIEAVAQFPADRVKLIGVNQAEPPEPVKRFLETRGWKLAVALDAQQNVARQYGVDGIPHTVIIGPNGKVAWVKTGYSPDGDKEAAHAIEQLLAPPANP